VRVLGFFGLAWEWPAPVARTGSASTVPVRQPPLLLRPPDPGRAGSQDTTFGRLQPQVIGEPIRQAVADDQLGSARWTRQPKVSADGGRAGPLVVRAASICGRRHARRGESREDAFAFAHAKDGTVVAAVADGLGDPSASYSAVGAFVASLVSCQLVCLLIEQGRPVDTHAVAARVAEEMAPQARRLIRVDFDDRSLATTLLIAWVSPQGAFRGFTIGDGGVVCLAAGQVSAVAAGRGGSFGDTDALPGGHARLEEFAGRLAPGSALLLATDGLHVPLQSPDVAGVLARAWERPPSLLEFLHDMSFERRGEADDRTGVAIWFDPGNTIR
jgi:serine/threonine protein phosphatase PrpC